MAGGVANRSVAMNGMRLLAASGMAAPVFDGLGHATHQFSGAGVIAAAALSTFILNVSRSMSQKTGFAPTYSTTFALAIKVNDGTITSSPGPISIEARIKCSAEVQELQAAAKGMLM